MKTLTNDFTESWQKVLKWRRISQAEVSRRTGISEKTVGKIINCESEGTIDNLVLMCLAANLPGEISEHIIGLSSHNLRMANEDHIWYNFVLRHMYTYSISEIRLFLQEKDIETYNKFPLITQDMEV